ncbi:MAG TPA: DUF4079 family protein [Desulfurivibrionaceae bacterium]|nr:DUF4079 family protein [Desulfurivibrionaceae bacterium]
MEFPLISRELVADLRIVHGLFNFAVVLLFFYTGRCGLMIRKARKNGLPLPVTAAARHRWLGPRLAILGWLGFAAGLALVLVDTGEVLKYPAHLLVGVVIVALLCATFLVSRKIKGPNSPYRDTHFRLGLAILSLYLLQVFIGLGVLL